jgi:ATP-dependent DNA helicase RecG
LGLIVVDEQHRFGVDQREALRLKGKLPPHVLTMTATPIPRTLAVTVFGDLDVSILTELPAGRQAITSHVITDDQPALVARVWQRVAEEVSNGRQAFVVCPRIDETDVGEELIASGGAAQEDEEFLEEGKTPKPKRPLAAAISVAEALKKNPALQGLKISVLHGRQSSEEKNEIMTAFSNKEIDVLVSTTVIEVGVDVPNATVMVIMDADRFGVSQLHQLRGRIGRGSAPGLCLLVTGAEPETPARLRLDAVAATQDGFELSRIDLEQRREGDVMGASQSGAKSKLRLLRVLRDEAMIEVARDEATALIEQDPALNYESELAMALAQLESDTASEFIDRG